LTHEILLRQLKLESDEKSFVLVDVVRTEGPTAVKAGNKAIILANGGVEGWIGGHCTEDEIVRNSLECLREGKTRFLNLTTCQGGRMDVYLEPYLPKRRLVIFGHVPIVEALARLAKQLNFSVAVVDRHGTKEKLSEADVILDSLDEKQFESLIDNASQTYAVVATMGESDLESVTRLCRLNLPYIGVVAGKKRANAIYAYLRSVKIPEREIDKVKAPAGIYIRAVTAGEIALSIMAEIVEIARSQNAIDSREIISGTPREKALADSKMNSIVAYPDTPVTIDPVCGMTVSSSSDYFLEFNGQMRFFCSSACKESFESEPQKYLLMKSESEKRNFA
jgi:xanthine dehydrogenase accessory factor